MLGGLLGKIGAMVGSAAGGGIFATIGRFTGRKLGDYLEQRAWQPDEFYRTSVRLDDLMLINNSTGCNIPLCFGTTKVEARLIWASLLEEVAINNTDLRYFKDNEFVRQIHKETNYLYYANVALGLAEGPVAEFTRVWVNGQLKALSEYNYRFYNGSEQQLPDPLIARFMGPTTTTAFRGLSYIVFERLPLAEFNNNLPQFSFEITSKPQQQSSNNLEQMLTNMVMIPGSGEFVYDTIIQEKIISNGEGSVLLRQKVNCHNAKNQADALASLDQLQQTCPNLAWVAPVVCWFADDISAGKINILPAVEYNDLTSTTSEEWQVEL